MRRIGWLIGIVLLLTSCRAMEDKKLPPPFRLTADEEKNVDGLLARWEQWNAGLKTYQCRFKRWTYDETFGRPGEATHIDFGTIQYATSGRWLFRVDSTEKDGQVVPVEDARAEHWLSDGKAIYQYDHAGKRVVEYKLPPEFQTSRLADGPLTFPIPGLLFSLSDSPWPCGAEAAELKKQYYLREITPAGAKDEIRLEAFPRSTKLEIVKLEVIFHAKDMSPSAMKIVDADGKDSVAYQFFDVAVNGPSADKAPFEPTVPRGWQKVLQ